MTAVGFAWFASGVSAADDDVLYTIGITLDALFPVIAGHLVLAFPTGRLETRLERIVIGVGYVAATVLQLPSLLFEEHSPGSPRNLLVIEPDQDVSDLLDGLQFAVVLPVIAREHGDPHPALVRRERTAAARPRARAVDRRRGVRRLRGRGRARRRRPDGGGAGVRRDRAAGDRAVRLPRRAAAQPARAGRPDRRADRAGRPGGRSRLGPRGARGGARRPVGLARLLAAGVRALRRRRRPAGRAAGGRVDAGGAARPPVAAIRHDRVARRRARSSCARSGPRRRSRWRTSGSRRSCARGSRTCARRAPGS